jgi:hypothetical protein
VRCEEPNDKVNDITAQLVLEGAPPALLTEENFLLRGCQLRNTEWVLALVVACGVQTKINYYPGAERKGTPTPWRERLRRMVQETVAGSGPKAKVKTHPSRRSPRSQGSLRGLTRDELV